MTILPRETKNGTVYFIRVSLGYINGKQQTKGMTYKPEKVMKPKAVDKELNRIAVFLKKKPSKNMRFNYSVKPTGRNRKITRLSLQRNI